MLMAEKYVPSPPDQHPIKTAGETCTANKDGVDSKNLIQINGDNVSAISVPYNTLSLGRKTKRGISQLSEEDESIPTLEEKGGEGKKELLSFFTVETPEYILILPDINTYPPDFRDFLKRDLLETSTLISLEHAGRLNWWVDLGICRRLFPLVTIGDGNCLLHAASLALTGLHDNRLVLRRALSKMMCSSQLRNTFFRRWRWHQTILNKQELHCNFYNEDIEVRGRFEDSGHCRNSGVSSQMEIWESSQIDAAFFANSILSYLERCKSELVFTEMEWMEEWNNLAKLASTQPRIPSQPPCDVPNSLNNKQRQCEECDEMEEILYESLEEFHVFILAHVLKRTIIIIADTILKNLNGEPLAPISFGGIYLPLECSPSECLKSPLLLTYDAAHFSALVPMEDDSDATNLADAVPLVDPDFELLPVHFAYDPGPQFQWSALDDNYNVGLHQQNEQDLFKLLQSYMDIKFLSVPYAGEFEQKLDKKESDKDLKDVKDKTCDCSQSVAAAFNFSDSTGNSSRTCSSQSSPEENSVESSKSDADYSKRQDTNNKSNKNKKFSSIKKRISKTLKMGLCASGIQQEADDVEEKKAEHSGGNHHFLKKAKSMEDNKETKTVSPKNCENSKSEIKTSNQSTNEIISSLDTKLNHENVKSQLTDSTAKQDVQLKCPDRVLCARLYHKRDENQDRILNRYFAMAEERFQQFKKDDRRENQNSLPTNCHLDPHQTSAGYSQPSSNHSTSTSKPATMQCINSGCMGLDACAETSYLCRECFERQKQEELDLTLKMTSSKQILTNQPQQAKYLSSPSSSSSTIQLPLIKNSSHGNSQFMSYKHVPTLQHQQNYPNVNCYQKPSQLFQPMKSHVITSSSGAAAFNKSFESNFKENCIVSPSGNSYVGPSFTGPANIIPNHNNNTNKYLNTNMVSGKVICSPIKAGEAPHSVYARTRIKNLQAADSSQPTMYASEEEDDEDDGVTEEKNRGRKFTSQSKINSHEQNSSCILTRNNQKLTEAFVSKSRPWDNGFRSSSFDDNNCHSTTIASGVGPWVSKTTACKTEGCSFYGTANSDYFCSRCYKQKFGDYDVSLGIPPNKSIVL